MKKFSKVLEEVSNLKYYKIKAEIELIVEAESEGEAGYLGDSILGGIEEQSIYTVLNIEETEDRLNETLDLKDIKSSGKSEEEQIKMAWEKEFSDTEPTETETMEWYHQMRSAGYDGVSLFKILKNKI